MARGQATRGAGGKFTGSKGGTAGGQTFGGSRGVAARSRLRQALAKVRDAKAQVGGTAGKEKRSALKLLARKLRHARLHQREVARVERRGLQSLLKRGDRRTNLKVSRSELRGIRQDRVFFAREKIQALRARIRGDAFVQRSQAKSSNPLTAGIARRDRASYAKQLRQARRALRNRKRELARIS